MTYEWQPEWPDLEGDGPQNLPRTKVYLARLRRMVMAGVNWMAEHPTADPTWREVNRDAVARNLGHASAEGLVFIGAWEDFYQPTNAHARHWFRAMADACGKGNEAPTIHMMDKAVGCSMLFKTHGWDEFNSFMLTGGEARH